MGNYQDVKKQIALFFDNELCQDEMNNLLNQVGNDPKCCSMFEKEKKFRNYIKSNITRPQVSSDLINLIRTKITTEI
jgi:hypothetical protein